MDNNATKDLTFVANSEERIDKFLASETGFSRVEVQRLIEEGRVVVGQNTKVRKSSFLLKQGVTVTVISIKEMLSVRPLPIAQDIPLRIIYEDSDLVVVDKAAGMVVHPSPGHRDATLVNALRHHFDTLSDGSSLLRPGIVHRLDKDTSGLLIVAKHNEAHRILASAFRTHQIKRTYYALVEGILPNEITHIDLPIGRDLHSFHKREVKATNAKHALTHVYVVKYLTNRTLVRCELETGRTHQIRVHLAYIKHQVVGDVIYGERDEQGLCLHAAQLEFIQPITNELITVKASVPAWLAKVLP